MLIARSSLSVFFAVYEWLRSYGGQSGEHRIWDSVAGELMMAVALLPLLRANLSAAFWLGAYCSDASLWGGAVLHSIAFL